MRCDVATLVLIVLGELNIAVALCSLANIFKRHASVS
jgi:hypothetical protein